MYKQFYIALCWWVILVPCFWVRNHCRLVIRISRYASMVSRTSVYGITGSCTQGCRRQKADANHSPFLSRVHGSHEMYADCWVTVNCFIHLQEVPSFLLTANCRSAWLRKAHSSALLVELFMLVIVSIATHFLCFLCVCVGDHCSFQMKSFILFYICVKICTYIYKYMIVLSAIKILCISNNTELFLMAIWYFIRWLNYIWFCSFWLDIFQIFYITSKAGI